MIGPRLKCPIELLASSRPPAVYLYYRAECPQIQPEWCGCDSQIRYITRRAGQPFNRGSLRFAPSSLFIFYQVPFSCSPVNFSCSSYLPCLVQTFLFIYLSHFLFFLLPCREIFFFLPPVYPSQRE